MFDWILLLYGAYLYVTSDPPPPDWAIGLLFVILGSLGIKRNMKKKREEERATRSS